MTVPLKILWEKENAMKNGYDFVRNVFIEKCDAHETKRNDIVLHRFQRFHPSKGEARVVSAITVWFRAP